VGIASQRAASERNLRLRFRPTTLWVESDPVMIERIIANLLSNALRYTPPGGRVLLAARRRGDAVMIEVRDSGVGIATEHQAAIFAEFYQVGNAAREHCKGLGLGLSIGPAGPGARHDRVRLAVPPGRGTTRNRNPGPGRPATFSVSATRTPCTSASSWPKTGTTR
jgi:K+-sensing histidine kinase KdpD